MHAHEELPARKSAGRAPTPRKPTAVPQSGVNGPMTQGAMIALQRSIGNQGAHAVQRRMAPPEQEQHVHGAGCNHGEVGSVTESEALEAAKAVPASPLPAGVRQRAESFHQFNFGGAKLRTGPVVARAAALMRATAFTIDDVAYIPEPGNPEIDMHEANHLKMNLSGKPETGHNDGSGVAKTRPNQTSEMVAAGDGAAAARGEKVAPSVVAQRAVDEDAV